MTKFSLSVEPGPGRATMKEAAIIKAMLKRGDSAAYIADHFNITLRSIYQIADGVFFAHVKPAETGLPPKPSNTYLPSTYDAEGFAAEVNERLSRLGISPINWMRSLDIPRDLGYATLQGTLRRGPPADIYLRIVTWLRVTTKEVDNTKGRVPAPVSRA